MTPKSMASVLWFGKYQTRQNNTKQTTFLIGRTSLVSVACVVEYISCSCNLYLFKPKSEMQFSLMIYFRFSLNFK
jgi:hypothetical protein